MTKRTVTPLADGRYRVTVMPADELQVKGGTVDLEPGDYKQYCAWLKDPGASIQAYLPGLGEDMREILLSGLTPETWTEVFGGGPE